MAPKTDPHSDNADNEKLRHRIAEELAVSVHEAGSDKTITYFVVAGRIMDLVAGCEVDYERR